MKFKKRNLFLLIWRIKKMRYFGFAKETTYGTAVTTAEMYLNCGKCTLDTPDSPTLDVPSFEETPSAIKAGLYSPSGDVELALDIHSILPILYFTFGQYQFTEGGTGEPNIHEIWAGGCHRLPSFTAMVGKGDCGNSNEEFEHQFLGCVISKLSLSLSNGLATCTASIQAQKDKPATIQTDVDLEEICPIAFHEAETTLDNEDITADTTSFTFDFDNGVKAEDGQVFGSMFPVSLSSNGKTPTVSTELVYHGKKYTAKFWGSNTGPTKTTSYFDYHIEFTDEDGNILQLYFPKCALKKVSQPIEGTDKIKHSLSLAVLKGEVTLNDDETKVRTSCLATITSDASAYISA